MKPKHAAEQREAFDAGSVAARHGLYILVLEMAALQTIAIGRRGEFEFPAGFYLYVGSAHGPGGVRGRLRHHIAPVVKAHWHVDYLRAHAPCVEVWWAYADGARECTWAAALLQSPGARLAAPHFGASDCGCAGHLVWLAEQPHPPTFAPHRLRLRSTA